MSDERAGRRMGGAELEGVGEHKDEFASFHAPYRNAVITLIDKPSDDVPLMEMRIREGRRITVLELDSDTAENLAKTLQCWADKVQNKGA
ncbi:MAG: hypothetical protein GY927_05275 [bacterium]|nr:hypothetical protein [bacterium]